METLDVEVLNAVLLERIPKKKNIKSYSKVGKMDNSENKDFAPEPSAIKEDESESFGEKYDTRKLYLGIQRHLPLIISCALIWAMFGAYMAYKLLTTYKAESVVLFQEEKPGHSSVGLSLTNMTLPTVLDMIKLPAHFQAVKSILGLDLTAKELEGMTDVPLPRNDSNLIRIITKGDNPQLVVDISNTLAKIAVRSSQEFNQRQLQLTLDNYKTQLDMAKQRLMAQLQEMENFKQENHYFEMNADYAGLLKQITDLQARLQSANLTYNSLLVEYENLKREADSLPDEVLVNSSMLNSRESPLQSRIASVEAALSEARTKYAKSNPKIRALEEELKALSAKANEAPSQVQRIQVLEKNPVKEKLEVDLMKMQGKVRSAQKVKQDLAFQMENFKNEMDRLPSLQIAFSKLLQAKQTTEEQLRYLNTAVDKTQSMINVPKGSIEIYQLAEKAKPVKDAWWVELLPVLGLIFGTGFGTVLAFLLELNDKRLWTAKQIDLAYHVPVVTTIPEIPAFSPKTASAQTLFYTRIIAERLEKFQAARGRSYPVIVALASSLENEGKTTIAYHLAQYYKRIGKNPLFLEFDYRFNPYVGEESETAASLERFLQNPHGDFHSLIQPGKVDWIKMANPEPEMKELIKSPAMAKLLHELSNRYDVIVIDAPSIIHDDYALNVCSLADYCLFVVGSSEVTKSVVDESLRELNLFGIKPHGIILNRVLPAYIDDQRIKLESKKNRNKFWQTLKFWKK